MIAAVTDQLSSKWWTFLVRGIAALAVAGCALGAPLTTAAALVYIVGAFFIITGISAIVAGFSFTGVGHWWALVIMGIVQGFLGFMMFAYPGYGPLALAFLFAIWLIMTGVAEISSAMAMRNVIQNEFWWLLLGSVTLAFGIYVVVVPALGLLALVYTVGYYGIFAGISLIALAFRIKGLADPHASRQSAPA